MKKTMIILLHCLLPALLIAGNPQQDLIIKADSAYNSERYADAAAMYQSILEEGFESAALYYNLGNAYFNLNNLPAAILNYERARVLAPRDEDIIFNLNIANSMITDKIEAVPEIFYIQWWKSLRDSFNLYSWTLTSIAVFALLVFCLGTFVLSRNLTLRKISFWTGMMALMISIVSFSITYTKYDIVSKHLEAIVFEPTVTVKSSPNQLGKDLFVIHEGTKVFIQEEISGWCNIKIANGSAGWMPVESIRRI